MSLIGAAVDDSEDPRTDFIKVFVWVRGPWGRAGEATVPFRVVGKLHLSPSVSPFVTVFDPVVYDYGETIVSPFSFH